MYSKWPWKGSNKNNFKFYIFFYKKPKEKKLIWASNIGSQR